MYMVEASPDYRKLRELAIDSTLLLGISYFTLSLYCDNGSLPNGFLLFEEFFFISILTEAIFYIYELYGEQVAAFIKDFFIRLAIVLMISGIVISGLYFYPPLHRLVEYFLTDIRWGYIALLLLIVTALRQPFVSGLFNKIFPPKQILIFGAGEMVNIMNREVISRKSSKYKIVGFVQSQGEEKPHSRNVDVLKQKGELLQLALKRKVNKIVVATGQRRGNLQLEELLACKTNGIEVVEAQTFYEEIAGKLSVRYLHPSWLIFTPGFKHHPVTRAVKDVFDIVFASIGLVATAPLMLITAGLIKLDSPGPVLFKQERVGQGGRTFVLIKFRTMYHGAENESGPVWAQENDIRITRVGRVIRKLRIDELPQMLNVLQGEMSFVGPRPERPYFVRKLEKIIPYYNQRLTVKPGITGWAAVNYQYGASVDDAIEKLQYDLYYIKNLSLLLDILTALKTINVMFSGKGSR